MTDSTPAPATPALTPNTKRYAGPWMIWRRTPRGLKISIYGNRMPRFRHPSFEATKAEAERLVRMHPECVFLIMQEAARVKMKPVETINAAA